MRFALTIETGNAGMVEDVEGAVSEALHKVAEQVIDRRTSAPIFDHNGNTVGRWELEGGEE